ncbi:MAG: DUF3667 domain-containing protein [Bacteroidota bacterium]
MECKNCGNHFEGQFCNLCGQNIRVDKLTLQNFLEELSDSIFQVNHGLFYTIKCLFVRPGHSIRAFLDGQRKKHVKPIAFVLTLSTVYFLVSQLSDSPTLIDDFLAGYTDRGEEQGFFAEKSPILHWLSDNYAYATLLMIPVFSFASYIAFLDLKKNYLEHIVINSFITGQQALFYSFFMVVGVVSKKEDITVLIAVIASISYNYWAYVQCFMEQKKGSVMLRLFLAYFLSAVFFSVALFVAVVPSLKF